MMFRKHAFGCNALSFYTSSLLSTLCARVSTVPSRRLPSELEGRLRMENVLQFPDMTDKTGKSFADAAGVVSGKDGVSLLGTLPEECHGRLSPEAIIDVYRRLCGLGLHPRKPRTGSSEQAAVSNPTVQSLQRTNPTKAAGGACPLTANLVVQTARVGNARSSARSSAGRTQIPGCSRKHTLLRCLYLAAGRLPAGNQPVARLYLSLRPCRGNQPPASICPRPSAPPSATGREHHPPSVTRTSRLLHTGRLSRPRAHGKPPSRALRARVPEA